MAKKINTQDLFGYAFERLKNAFNTQKACLKKKNTRLVKKLKAFLRVKKT